MKQNKLFAGPWIGEFGWELFCWQAYLRKIAKQYDHITVCSRPGKEFLYQDFVHKFLPFQPASEDVSMWANYGLDENYINRIFAPPLDTIWLDPRKFLSTLSQERKKIPGLTVLEMFTPPDQEFIAYGNPNKDKAFDIVIHARNRTDKKAWPEKNWPIENWNALVTHFSGMRIACVGHLSASNRIDGTIDLRGIPLNEVADVLASSKLCVGCSDGLLNFAALCKTPRLIWTIKSEADKNIDRHSKCWNPFNIPVQMVIHDTWRPPSIQIIKAIEEYFE